MAFRIGDKVRSKLNNNLVGFVDNIHVWYTNTIDVLSKDGNDMIVYSNQDNWELYFEVGDIVVHKSSGKIYQIYRAKVDTDNDSNRYALERFNNYGVRCNRFDVLSDDIRMASDTEKSEFYRLKELHETKEKETKEMTTYKVGDIVNHPLYNESIIVDISEFETGYISIMPLTGYRRGQTVLVSIDNIKQADDKLIISIEDYNKMVNTIEDLKKEKADLKERLYLANDKAKCAETILAMNTPRSNKLPEVKEVLYHKPATIIFWKDGTKTVVKTQNKEKYDKEKGFVMAYLKKILGNEGNYYEEIKRWTDIQ